MRILPAILTSDPTELKSMLAQVESFTTTAHLDIMDGRFVPSRSITAQDLEKVTSPLELEIHLMTLQPEEYLQPFKKAGARRIVFHLEAIPDPLKVVRKARSHNLSIGIALNPYTPMESVYPFLSEIDFVLFLSVHPGFYGRKFIPHVLRKACAFKKIFPQKEVGMDGGIKKENILRIKACGIDYVCVGSGIFYGNPKENYLELVSLINSHYQST